MVWNDIIAWINSNLAEIGVTFLGGLEAVKMIMNRMSFNKVYSSTVTPITSSNNVVYNKVLLLESQVEKLVTALQKSEASNASKDAKFEQLSNLVITSLAIANVPLSAKEALFKNISKVKLVSDEASLFLGKMIEAQQRQASTVQVSNDEAINNLKNGV
jgi:hypothetical protein